MFNLKLYNHAFAKYQNGDHLKIRLLTRGDANTKLIKGEKKGYMTTGLSLAPAKSIARKLVVCSHSTAICERACLSDSGLGSSYMKRKTGSDKGFNVVSVSRALKTIFMENNFELFVTRLKHEISLFEKRAIKANMIPCIRLNILSDFMWHTKTDIMQSFPDIQFYNYSKVPAFKNLPDNYHLTFSRAENNESDVMKAINHGLNIAVVFNGGLPKTYMGLPVINGDETDLRFLDNEEHDQVIVGLTPKGRNIHKEENKEFMVDTASLTSKIIKIAA